MKAVSILLLNYETRKQEARFPMIKLPEKCPGLHTACARDYNTLLCVVLCCVDSSVEQQMEQLIMRKATWVHQGWVANSAARNGASDIMVNQRAYLGWAKVVRIKSSSVWSLTRQQPAGHSWDKLSQMILIKPPQRHDLVISHTSLETKWSSTAQERRRGEAREK